MEYRVCSNPLCPSQIESFENHSVVSIPFSAGICQYVNSYVPPPLDTKRPVPEDRWWWRRQTIR